MITNDIQELLDGTLSDERMAEMLHTLSVSPEKRAAFRHHMALRSAMERDRTASALTSAEDAVIWGGIASAVQAPVTAPAGAAAATGVAGWMGRAAALVIVGVAGYLLGSNDTTNIFNGGAPQPAVTVRTTTPQQPEALVAVPIPQATMEPALTSTTVGENIAQTHIQKSFRPNTVVVNTSHDDRVQETQPPSNPVTTSQNPGLPSQQLGTAMNTSDKTDASQPEVQPSQPSLQTNAPKTETTPPPTQPEEPALRQHPQQPVELMKPPVASLYTSGLEVAFGERVGRISPTPYGIEDADPDFSNRSVDVSYRFPTSIFGTNSSIGIGLRGIYGTFSTVGLDSTPVSATEIPTFAPKLEAKKGWAGEVFVNYRQPLLDWLALGVEASFAGSTGGSAYNKWGGDLFVLAFVTDRIGIQAGGGYAQYRYNLSDQREQLFRDNPNAAITSEASDSYQGGMVQFRYGLFYRF